jgi:hypothetical protein
MKTAERVLTFVSAGVGILTAFICFIYCSNFNELLANSQVDHPKSLDLISFSKGLLLFLIIGCIVSAIYAFIAGSLYSSDADPSIKKALGIVAIIISMITNTALLLGGIFAVVSASREISTKEYHSSTINNNSNNDDEYSIYR